MRSHGPGEIWRAERVRAARRLHPDVGGDLQEYLQVTSEIDRRHGHPANPLPPGQIADLGGSTSLRNNWQSRARRRLRVLARRRRALSRTTRSALPKWAPGARRYTQI